MADVPKPTCWVISPCRGDQHGFTVHSDTSHLDLLLGEMSLQVFGPGMSSQTAGAAMAKDPNLGGISQGHCQPLELRPRALGVIRPPVTLAHIRDGCVLGPLPTFWKPQCPLAWACLSCPWPPPPPSGVCLCVQLPSVAGPQPGQTRANPQASRLVHPKRPDFQTNVDDWPSELQLLETDLPNPFVSQSCEGSACGASAVVSWAEPVLAAADTRGVNPSMEELCHLSTPYAVRLPFR